MPFYEWYLIGLVSSAFFVFIVNSHFKTNVTYGDVAFASLLALAGPLTTAGIIAFGIILFINNIILWNGWKKPIFANKRWKDD